MAAILVRFPSILSAGLNLCGLDDRGLDPGIDRRVKPGDWVHPSRLARPRDALRLFAGGHHRLSVYGNPQLDRAAAAARMAVDGPRCALDCWPYLRDAFRADGLACCHARGYGLPAAGRSCSRARDR